MQTEKVVLSTLGANELTCLDVVRVIGSGLTLNDSNVVCGILGCWIFMQ